MSDKIFPLKINKHLPCMLFQNGQMVAKAETPSHAIEIMRRFNAYESSVRLKRAASKAAEALHELGHDAYNDLAMALVDFERKIGEIE